MPAWAPGRVADPGDAARRPVRLEPDALGHQLVLRVIEAFHANGQAGNQGRQSGVLLAQVERRFGLAYVSAVVKDNDDRPERMVRDPDHYFAEARQRAMRELVRTDRWLFPSLLHQKRP